MILLGLAVLGFSAVLVVMAVTGTQAILDDADAAWLRMEERAEEEEG